MSDAPSHVAIDRDDHHARYVGQLPDGRQFFLTTPFVAAVEGQELGAEFVAVYLFDTDGKFLSADIESFGPRAGVDEAGRQAAVEKRLRLLGDATFTRISVRPFSTMHDGIRFGLIASAMEDDPGEWTVELLPGNYMAFFEPWDSGDYDT